MGNEIKEAFDSIIRKLKITAIVLPIVIVLFFSWFRTPEGHVDVVLKFGKADRIATPGLNFKIPLVETTHTIDVRMRKYTQRMQVSTTGKAKDGTTELQMPSTVIMSANWKVPVDSVMDVYKQYGGLSQYEDKILDPRVFTSTKTAFAKYSIEGIISNRQLVTADVDATLGDLLRGHSVVLSDVNIEDVIFPEKIKNAVEKKQTAKLEKEAEEYNLQKQNLQAQRGVNTAKAKAEGIDVVAKAQAQAIKIKGLAEAEAIDAKGKALRNNPLIVDLTKAQRWNGSYITHNFGSSPNLLMDMRNDKPDSR